MIKVQRVSSGLRREGGQWQRGGIVFTVDLAHRAMTLISGETVVAYKGTIEAAHGLFVFAGADPDTGKLTLVDHFGLVLRQVDQEHVRPVPTHAQPAYLPDAVMLDAESEVISREMHAA